MKKPVLKQLLTHEQIEAMEKAGHEFDMFDDKRVIGQSKAQGYEILFLEDGGEVIRSPKGNFIKEWPRGAS